MTVVSPQFRQFLLLALAGTLAAALKLSVLDGSAFGPGFESVNVARSLAAGNGFADPYSALATGPTAHTAPVYPYLLSIGIRLLGFGGAFAAVCMSFNLIFQGIQAALLPGLSAVLLGDRVPGLWAAGLLIALPLIPLTAQGETDLQILALMLCTLIPVAGWSAAPAALLAALALHLNPSSLLLLPGWLVWKRPPRRWLLVWGFTLAAAMLPWTIRNYQTFGGIFFIRDNLGLELRVSNNDLAGASAKGNGASLAALHPMFNTEEARALIRASEPAYMAECGRQASDWIRAHPSAFARFTLIRAALYWFPAINDGHWQAWLLTLITILSLGGILRVWKHPVFFFGFAVAPLLYYLLQADPRYRYPYFWLTLLVAGAFLHRVYGRLRRKPEPS
ncbi:MAG TPA: hypothetical protein VGK29_05595 [Paludibaculum sp.]|jgi:hypothetical protein